MVNGKTIYEYLKGYSKDEVDVAIALLDEGDKYLLHMLFEMNLDLKDIDSKNYFYLYKFLIPKLKNIMENRRLSKKNDYLISKKGLIKINVYKANSNLLDIARIYMENIDLYQELLNLFSLKEVLIALLLKRLEYKYEYNLKDIMELFDIKLDELKIIKEHVVPLLDSESKMIK